MLNYHPDNIIPDVIIPHDRLGYGEIVNKSIAKEKYGFMMEQTIDAVHLDYCNYILEKGRIIYENKQIQGYDKENTNKHYKSTIDGIRQIPDFIAYEDETNLIVNQADGFFIELNSDSFGDIPVPPSSIVLIQFGMSHHYESSDEDDDDETVDLGCLTIYYNNKNVPFVNYIIRECIDSKKIKWLSQKKSQKITYYRIAANNRMYLESFSFEPKEVDIQSNYNNHVIDFYNKLIDSIKNEPNGLFLLKGDPGTGKTSILLAAVQELHKDKTIIIASNTFIANMDRESFTSFLPQLNNSVIIIEEAESLVEDRGSNLLSPIAPLLNATDGFLGASINMHIICTFNINNKKYQIDDALLRKGRLKAMCTFDKLSVDKSNKLLEKLGKNTTTSVPMTLADIYNYDSDNKFGSDEQNNSVGFKI